MNKNKTISGKRKTPMKVTNLSYGGLTQAKPRVRAERTGEFYQREFPGFYSRPLTEGELAISHARGIVRRARRATRHGH